MISKVKFILFRMHNDEVKNEATKGRGCFASLSFFFFFFLLF